MPTYYKADQPSLLPADYGYHDGPWKPSIFMPRWASRITLEITNIRAERLQEITEEDARDEGVIFVEEQLPGDDTWRPYARKEFESLWNSLNAKRGHGWQTNPWVWVVEFKRIDDAIKG
jgi:hypothetical protein